MMDNNISLKAVLPPFDSVTLMAVTKELEAHLIGGQIQDVRQPAPADIQLGIRSHGKNYLLHLSANPQFARVHLTETRLPNPPSPPTFCMSLRKYLENGVIRLIRQIDFDRIFEMVIERIDENGTSKIYRLIAELMGKHSNLVLVGPEGTVLEAALRVSSKINRFRETLPGKPYISPPSQSDKQDPFDFSKASALFSTMEFEDLESTQKNILTLFKGISPFLVKEILFQVFNAQIATDHYSRLAALALTWRETFRDYDKSDFRPSLIKSEEGLPLGAYPCHVAQIPDHLQVEAASLNFALDDIYRRRLSSSNVHSLLVDLQSRLTRQLHRAKRSVESQRKSIDESERAAYHRQSGEMILANIWKIEPEDNKLLVQDYFASDLVERTIELDPKISPQENAEVYFKRYRKAKERGEVAAQMIVEAVIEETAVQKAMTELLILETDPKVIPLQIHEFADRLRRLGMLSEEVQTGSGKTTADASPFEGHKIRRFRVEGFEVLVGETATANDFLTTKVASANDIWLHVRAATSAHVIIRTKGSSPAVPTAVLMEAAKICARHSGQKHSSLITVDYTLRKYVRKPRGAKPGSVDYQREKSLEITLES